MRSLSLAAATLSALACAACHSEQTRNKIDDLVAEQEAVAAENAATNGAPATANEAQPQ